MMQNGLVKLTTSNLYLGEIVYKAKAPGEEGYALPDKYKSGSDLNDYYHVGVISSVKPLVITHCTSVPGGIARDTKLGKWKYGGKLKEIAYDEQQEGGDPVMKEAIVVGGRLNMRKQPSTDGALITRIPDGTTINVVEETNNEWCKVSYAGDEGYVMKKFLELKDPEKCETISVSKNELEKIYDMIGDWLGLRG